MTIYDIEAAATGYYMGVPVPRDVLMRHHRLSRKYGRVDYLQDWAYWQLEKQRLGI